MIRLHERHAKSEELLTLLNAKLGQQIVNSGIELGDAVIEIRRESVLDFFRLLKLDAEFQFNLLLSLTAVDWMDSRENRFEVVYHLLSLSTLHRLRVKIPLTEDDPTVDSVTPLWSAANFLEREAWDMYGVNFRGHPNLERILMYDEFKGHPLRKDYPVQGKQPRVTLRHPEVENTARHMQRPPLVQIGTRGQRSDSAELQS